MAEYGKVARIFLFTTLYWSSYLLNAYSLGLESFAEAQWPNHGGGIENWRQAKKEFQISSFTLPLLKPKWRVATGGDVTATPALANGIVYFPTWTGEVFAVREKDGSLVWRQNLTELVKSTTAVFSRHTPVVEKEYLLVGLYVPASLLALNINTGAVIWSKVLDPNPTASITMSGTVYNGEYYVGVSSIAWTVLQGPCCSFQGSMTKVDIRTGAMKWQTKMLPDNGGNVGLYSGASVWGSSPSIDIKRNAVYIGTGNLYSSPPNVTACEQQQNNMTTRNVPDPCMSADDHSDSLLALNLDTGKIIWARQLGGYDTWTLACVVIGPSSPNCPPVVGPDYDFGEAPMLLTVKKRTSSGITKLVDIVAAGQKSGIVWALDRDNGTLVWDAVIGPGSDLGGASWGAATDGARVFTNLINYYKLNFTLLPSNVVTTSGGWVAMDASSGQILWSTASPDGTVPIGPVTVANGVLFTTTMGSPNGTVYALDTKTGKVLWHYNVAASMNGGVSVDNGCIYFGEGISTLSAGAFLNHTNGHAVDSMCVF